jgi:glyoxylase I family protein
MTSAERPPQPNLDHLGLSVTDVDRSTSFYCGMLGAEIVFDLHELDWGSRTIVRLGTHFIDLNELRDRDGSTFNAARTGLDHLAFTARSREELEAWANWFDTNGVERTPIRDVRADPGQDPVAPVVGAMFQFSDPDGIELEFLFFDVG